MAETLHKNADYWDRGWRNVPDMTGARHLLAAPDLREVLTAFRLALPVVGVLDVGCGTGRAAQLCTGYVGTDIAPSAIEYCQRKKVEAVLMTGPHDMPTGLRDGTAFGTILCISVFTHMGREERRSYLAVFRQRAPRLVADIIRGDGTGDVSVWTALEDEYRADLEEAGYEVRSVADWQWDMHVHTYVYAEAA